MKLVMNDKKRPQPKISRKFQPTETMAEVNAAEEEKKREKAQNHSRGLNTGNRGNAPSKGKGNRGGNRR